MAKNEVSGIYAGALVEIGREKQILDQIEEELKFVKDLLVEDRDFMLYFIAPGIPKGSKKDIIDKVFSNYLSETIVSFLKVVIDKERQASIRDINESLIELIDIENNRQRIEVVSSVKLNTEIVNKIEVTLGNKLGKEIILKEVVDETILGGIIIKIGDLVFDGSVIKDLRNIKRNLVKRKVGSEVGYED